MKNIVQVAVLSLLVLGCKENQEKTKLPRNEAVADTEITPAEDEWTMIFDGRNF